MQLKKFFKRSWEVIILALMISYDASLHWVEIIKVWNIHPLYPHFPLLNIITYNMFWTSYWTIAFLLTIKILINLNKK